jgi:hypothetical protein
VGAAETAAATRAEALAGTRAEALAATRAEALAAPSANPPAPSSESQHAEAQDSLVSRRASRHPPVDNSPRQDIGRSGRCAFASTGR